MKFFTIDDPREVHALLHDYGDEDLLQGVLMNSLIVALLYDMEAYGSECLVVCDPRDNPRLFVHWYVCRERSALVVDFVYRFGELDLTLVGHAFDVLQRIMKRSGLSLVGWTVPNHADFSSLLQVSRRVANRQHGICMRHRSLKSPVLQFLVRPEQVPNILIRLLGDMPVHR